MESDSILHNHSHLHGSHGVLILSSSPTASTIGNVSNFKKHPSSMLWASTRRLSQVHHFYPPTTSKLLSNLQSTPEDSAAV